MLLFAVLLCFMSFVYLSKLFESLLGRMTLGTVNAVGWVVEGLPVFLSILWCSLKCITPAGRAVYGAQELLFH